MAIISRTNLFRNPSFELDLSLWSAFGSASISRVSSLTWRMRVTFPTAAAGAAGAQTTVDGLTAGTVYRVWASVPNASGSTTVQMEMQGITTGAAFATNTFFSRQGAFTFTATGSTATFRIKSAVGSTAGDYVDVDVAICEVDQGSFLPPFDGSYPGAYWAGPVGMAPSVFEYFDTSSTTTPFFVVEFDARPVSTYDFVLDRDALDDANVALIDSPRWWRVIEAEQVEIRRGRQDDNQQMDAGTASITLRDYDGVYDPDNPATPLQINGVPVMRAGMRIRVSVLMNPVGNLLWEELFVGSLQDVTVDRSYDPITVVSAVDDMAKLSTSDIPPFDPPIRYGDRTFWRAVWALGFAGITWGDFTNGDDMLQRQMLATGGGGNALSALEEAAACEGGKVYVQRDGVLHVGSHSDDFATTPAAAFTDDPSLSDDIEYSTISTSTSIGKLINRSIVTRGDWQEPADGEAASTAAAPPLTGQDDESVALNERVWSETINAPLLNDSEAQALADWRATRRSTSATRVDSVQARLTGQGLLALLDAARLDLSSVVRVRRYSWGRGIDGTYSVEGIDHTITDQTWDMTVYTSPLDITTLFADQPQPFILDTSALDGADVMSSF